MLGLVASNHEIIIVHGARSVSESAHKLLHLSVDVAGGSFQLQPLLRHGLSVEFLTWYEETIVEHGSRNIRVCTYITDVCIYLSNYNYILYMYIYIYTY